jgi:hypothetical protein
MEAWASESLPRFYMAKNRFIVTGYACGTPKGGLEITTEAHTATSEARVRVSMLDATG